MKPESKKEPKEGGGGDKSDLTALMDEFSSQAQLAAARTVRIKKVEDLPLALQDYLAEKGVKTLLVAGQDRLDLQGMEEMAAGLGIRLILCDKLAKEEVQNISFECDASLTVVDVALAKTGSMVLLHGMESPRLPSVAPPVHIGLIFAKDLISDLNALGDFLEQRERLPSAVTVITGVSRTADINLNLTLGMHGPLEVLAVVVEEGS